MASPTVSVVIGTFNKARYIRETLQSVLEQTFRDFECLVIDDCSTDGTREIVEEFGDRVRLIQRSENSGCPAIPRNQGMGEAQGTYIAFLDADDLWHPKKLEQQVAFMEAHPDLAFSHASCEVIDEVGTVMRVRHAGAIPPTGQVFKEMLQHCYITTSTVMLRRSFFIAFGGMLEGREWRTGEDYEYYLRVAAKEEIGFLDEIVASYRSQGENQSISQESTNWRGIPEHIPTLLHILNKPDVWDGVVNRRDVERAIAVNCYENAWFWRERGDRDKALWFIRQALRVRVYSLRVFCLLFALLIKRS